MEAGLHTWKFLSTLSLRRATYCCPYLSSLTRISIHALLAESDRPRFSGTAPHIYFYPRSPCGERLAGMSERLIGSVFLSTLSLRRATSPHFINCMILTHFYPRSPCGERLTGFFPTLEGRKISIHALLAESDGPSKGINCKPSDFYPRSPCGERLISQRIGIRVNNFYPRSPCGERHGHETSPYRVLEFLSTLSLRRATIAGRITSKGTKISIHALLAESDASHLSKFNTP